MGALRDIKRDMAARRASLQKLMVHEMEARIFRTEPLPEAGGGGGRAATLKAGQQRSAPWPCSGKSAGLTLAHRLDPGKLMTRSRWCAVTARLC